MGIVVERLRVIYLMAGRLVNRNGSGMVVPDAFCAGIS